MPVSHAKPEWPDRNKGGSLQINFRTAAPSQPLCRSVTSEVRYPSTTAARPVADHQPKFMTSAPSPLSADFPDRDVSEVASSHAIPPLHLVPPSGEEPAFTPWVEPLLGNVTDEPDELPECPRWKRVLDLTLLVITAPCWVLVMGAIALWIRCVAPGPIIYRQRRVGQSGRSFVMWKFRTMRLNAETESHELHVQKLIDANGPMTKLDSAGDPRIIRGGRALRALGLDELPQILNIWRGEMSLVGPRPCTVLEAVRYAPEQRERFSSPPGLTGHWQVNGKNKTTFTEMVALDIFYVRNRSLRLDLIILAKTVPAIIGQYFEGRRRKPLRAVSGAVTNTN